MDLINQTDATNLENEQLPVEVTNKKKQPTAHAVFESPVHTFSSDDSFSVPSEQDSLISVRVPFTSGSRMSLRQLAIKLSLYVNFIIMVTKLIAYIRTLSLSVLAALIDSVLDIVSQFVLECAERHSSKVKRSSALYPAGASRLEPVGVLTCAALMGMASFEVIKESLEELLSVYQASSSSAYLESFIPNKSSFWSMIMIVIVKIALFYLCQYGITYSRKRSLKTSSIAASDSMLEALAQDHMNDCLSNMIAAIALAATLYSEKLWFLDPLGAILISIYIIYSWYATGREQIEQLTGKVAPDEFIEELKEVAANFDERMDVDVVRAYHFGPKFLVELEVVLPRQTPLVESHDLGMDLQYEIEGREEVERCFVHIDYETRPYDEHVVSKVPELRERYMRQRSSTSYYSV